MIDASTNGSARCAVHRDRLATFTCDRCGSFACETCRPQPREDLCRSCVDRAAAEAEAPLDAAEIIRRSFALPYERRRRVLLYALIRWIPILANAIVNEIAFGDRLRALEQVSEPAALFAALKPLAGALAVESALAGIVGLAVSASLTVHLADALDGGGRCLGAELGAGLGRLGALIAAHLLAAAAIGAGLLICCVPGIYLLVAFLLVVPIIVLGGAGPVQALAASHELVRRRWSVVIPLVAVLLAVSMAAGVAASGLDALGRMGGAAGQVAATGLAGFVQVLAYVPWTSAAVILFRRAIPRR